MALAIFRGEGQAQLRSYPVLSATVITKGDMLFLDSGTVKPAASFTWDTNIATTQAGFAAVFVGIAYTASASGETDPVQVDVSAESVWEFDMASATLVVGTPMGPAKASGNALENQKVVAAVAASSVFRASENYASATTRGKVTLASAYHTGSGNVNANVG